MIEGELRDAEAGSLLEHQTGNKRVEVVKTYDTSYDREVFQSMDVDALKILATALEIDRDFVSAM